MPVDKRKVNDVAKDTHHSPFNFVKVVLSLLLPRARHKSHIWGKRDGEVSCCRSLNKLPTAYDSKSHECAAYGCVILNDVVSDSA
jgi:hypothetical protein